MADADWHLYHQLRGKPLPETFTLSGVDYSLKKILKRDFYANVGIYQRIDGLDTPETPNQVLYKVYHTDSFWGVPLRWLGRWLAWRESRHFELLRGIEGVPQLLTRLNESTLVREFMQGCTLREYRDGGCPEADYFPELKRILAEIHARGMSHNDLSKPENLLVRTDGRPGVIDLQIALAPRSIRWPIIGWLTRAILRYFQRVDRYHINKLHHRARPEDFTAEELNQVKRKGILLHLHAWLLRKPYRAARRYIIKPLLLEKRPNKAA